MKDPRIPLEELFPSLEGAEISPIHLSKIANLFLHGDGISYHYLFENPHLQAHQDRLEQEFYRLLNQYVLTDTPAHRLDFDHWESLHAATISFYFQAGFLAGYRLFRL